MKKSSTNLMHQLMKETLRVSLSQFGYGILSFSHVILILQKQNHNLIFYLFLTLYSSIKEATGVESSNVSAHKRRYHRSSSSSAKRHKYHSTDLRPKPYFDTRINKETGLGARNITTVEGGRAIFICRIRHLGFNNTVSGILLKVIKRYQLHECHK